MSRPIAQLIKFLIMLALFVLYLGLNSEGLRILAPFLGRKLYKLPLPFFYLLGGYEGWRNLDYAYLVCSFFFFASWTSCYALMEYLLLGEVSLPKQGRVNAAAYQRVVLTISTVILVGDAITFYLGAFSRAGGWGASSISFTAIVITVGYCMCLVALAFWAVRLDLTKHQDAQD